MVNKSEAFLMKKIILKISGLTFKLPVREAIVNHLDVCVLNMTFGWAPLFGVDWLEY